MVEDTEGNLEEYFLKYNFTNESNSSRSTDMSLFTGTIETHDASGNLIGTTTINNGQTVSIIGMTSPPCDYSDNNDDDDTSDDNTSGNTSGGYGGNTSTGNDSDTNTGSGTDNSGSGGGEFENPDDEANCGLSYHYACNGGFSGAHAPTTNSDLPEGQCSGAGPDYGGSLIVTDCNGTVLGSSGGRNSTTDSSMKPNPCGDFGILLPEDPVDNNPCSSQDEVITKLNEMLNNEDINPALINLENHLESNIQIEAGVEFTLNTAGTYNQHQPVAVSEDGVEFSNPPLNNSKLRIHVHHSGLFSSPTWQDTFTQFPSYYNSTSDSDIVDMVLTESGLYAFTVHNVVQLQQMFDEIYVPIDPISGEPQPGYELNINKQNILNSLEKKYTASAKKAQIENNLSQEQFNNLVDESYTNFLKQIYNKYPGSLGLYKAKKVNGIYEWECIDLNN